MHTGIHRLTSATCRRYRPGRLACLALLVAVSLCGTTNRAKAQGIVELAPRSSGPYTGGETVTVDIIFHNTTATHLPIQYVRVDFTDSDPALTLAAAFDWALVPLANGNPTMPVPDWTEPGPPQNTIPAGGNINVGAIDVTLPAANGCYTLDCMNADESSRLLGAQLDWQIPTRATVTWRAFDGELTGGAVVLAVGKELCNGMDDDCDGLIDEDFEVVIVNPVNDEVIVLAPGDSCYTGEGECEGPGRIECASNGLEVVCVADLPEPGVEGPPSHPSCFDFKDNDCDGLTDHADPDCTGPELCDAFDNDNDGQIDEDFPGLGDACTVGFGLCTNVGIRICRADGASTVCNVQPYSPKSEGPPGTSTCADGLDNDCDTLVDLDDPDCQEPETCDGADNDGDGMIDEDFPTLGDACIAGVGACARPGNIICNAAGNGVQCSASPGRQGAEGPVGCACADGLDNDCDGLVDLADPDCGGSALRVQCSLPTTCAPADDDCRSWHNAQWQVLNGLGSEMVTAELIGLDTNGQVIASLPVQQGDAVRLTSRLNPADFEAITVEQDLDLAHFAAWDSCATGPDNGPVPAACKAFDSDCDDDIDAADYAWWQVNFGSTLKFHEMVAPTPLLHVQADNGYNVSDAVCSNVAALEVIQPQHEVISVGEGDVTRVQVAIANVDLSTLFVKVDGVDLLAGIGVDPATDFPGGPYGGAVQVGDCLAKVCNLVVDAAPHNTMAANTLTMNMHNLCCGGHVLVVDGEPLPDLPPVIPNPECHTDDVRDKGFTYGFEVAIAAPVPGEVTAGGPVSVTGHVCHGLEVICPFPTTCGPFVRLNGAWFPLSGPAFTPGDGEDSADRYDYVFGHDLTVRDWDQSTAPGTLHPAANRLYAEAWDEIGNAEFSTPVHFAAGPVHPPTADKARGTPAIPKATNLAIDAVGLEAAFAALMNDRLPAEIEAQMAGWLMKFDGYRHDINMPGPISDWTILIEPVPDSAGLSADPFVTSIGLQDNQMSVGTDLPDLIGQASARGQYRIKACGPFGNICICVARLTLDAVFEIRVPDTRVRFVVTEDNIRNGESVAVSFVVDSDLVDVQTVSGGLQIDCLAGFVFELVNIVLDIVNVAAQIVSFGNWNPDLDLGLPLEKYIEDANFDALLGLLQADPLQLEFFEIDDAPLPAFDTTLGFELADAQIDPFGLTVSYDTLFKPLSADAEVAPIAGTPLNSAPLPQPLIPAADAVTVAIGADVFNQLLYSLTYNGAFKTEFENVLPLGALLPPDCANAGSFEAQGQCEGFKGTACATLVPQAAEDACNDARLASALLNINAATPMVMHGRMDQPPKLVINDNLATPGVVEARLLLDQLSVGLAADRDGSGTYAGTYDTLPECSDIIPATLPTCRLWDSCYDIEFELQMVLVDSGGSPAVETHVIGRSLSHGAACGGGGGTPLPGTEGIDTVAQSAVLDILEQQVTDSVPPVQIDGLDFGGLVNFGNRRVLGIENNGQPATDDYLGITGNVAP